LAKLLKDAGGLGDAFLQEQLTIASHPSSANEQRTLPKKNTFTRQQLSKQSKTKDAGVIMHYSSSKR